ncbi:uncharacterized protein LOC122301818 [Carya illinoinensis]|uniref:uncharacterized protein LOC122301818 n=1 Tax=Carya illinoinensis TaxID=32201 RepID=UPI001C726CCA|nr:uncharacterized protein LOC122301818 [Carya illinoinensis]
MENLQALWGNFRLSEEEDTAITLENEATREVQRKGELCLIGKIWMDRSIGKNIIEATMAKIWTLSKQAKFTEVGSNVFIISFANHADRGRVIEGRPWLFDKHIFVIDLFDGFTQPSSMKFDSAAMWVQLHNMPLVGINKECGERIGRSLGEVEYVDVEEDNVAWGSFLRLRVRMNLFKPLARGRTTMLNGMKYWIPIQYEKLPRFCFDCGRILHEDGVCGMGQMVEE